jgi:hypothetical protein
MRPGRGQLNRIRAKARALNIRPVGLGPEELIRAIQRAEGNFDCFGTSEGYCNQRGCCFRPLCLKGDFAPAGKEP